MRLLSLNKYISFLIFFLISTSIVNSEDTIDIWERKKIQKLPKSPSEQSNSEKKENLIIKTKKNLDDISVESSISEKTLETKLYGTLDPEQNNFDLLMWSNTDGSKIRDIIKRISKLNLSKSSEELFINTIMTYSYLPQDMSDREFLDLKLNWLLKNKKDKLLENFLSKNNDFHNKEKVIQYLVDKNIARANLKEGCKKVNFISQDIKDAYLEKFKIYCLVFNNEKEKARLLLDLLREQDLSSKFFDNKINYLLKISTKTDEKIKDDNLLNFYLSSVTISNFKYEPDKSTPDVIWEYLNAANLIQLEDWTNIKKIQDLELAANSNTFDKIKIFEIYKKLPYELNQLINAEDIHQTFDNVESRALIYQKYLLSDNIEKRIKYLFLLKDLFKKDNLSNIFTEFMSDELKKMPDDKIPDSYKASVVKNIISDKNLKIGKIKYNDKVLHQSRIIRFYTEPGTPKQKTQKDLDNIYKKIKKNKKYFFSAKDLILIESLRNDGFTIPKEINYKEISKNYPIPSNFTQLVSNNEKGFLALKFVEILGADEIQSLDPETLYFISNILNEANLIKFRNKVIISSLPLRI